MKMRTINKPNFFSVLLIVLLFSLYTSLSLDSAFLLLDKSQYSLNENIKITLTKEIYPEYSLSIISPSNIYRYLGIPSSVLMYGPQENGLHTIELYNSTNSELIDKIEFFVGNEEITLPMEQSLYFDILTDKSEYDLGEVVVINFNIPFQNFSIKVTNGEAEFFYQNPKNPMFFRARATGNYIVSAVMNQTDMAQAFFTVLPKKQKISIADSQGKLIKGDLNFYSGNRLIESKNIQALENDTFYENKTYDVELLPNTRAVKKIRFKDMKINDRIELGVEDVPSQEGFIKSYAIDPTRLDFSEAVVTSVAVGKSLYKCIDWNFTQQKCYGNWKKIMDLIPGQEYSFTMTNQDPGYGESGDLPEPHTVTGYIYQKDNVTRADNGIPVKVIDNTLGSYALTQVYAPPLPQYKGLYSVNFYGVTGDSITVRAWNLSFFGEINTTLLATTTRANVTFQYPRKSEANVSLIYPNNNSLFNITKTFNVTSRIMILGDSGTNCYATVSLSNNITSLFQGETNTIYLGNIALYDSVISMWNFTANMYGITNISVNASCQSDEIILEGLNSARKNNITVQDRLKPEITLISPLNNTEVTNPVRIIFNASDHTGIENCSLLLGGVINQTIFNQQMYVWQTFSITLAAGNYYWKIGCYDNSSYKNYNETELRFFILPSWHFYFGNLSSRINLMTSGNASQFSWQDQATANIYVIETGSAISWSNLQALGRNISNMSTAQNDFEEADINLSMSSFLDSINTTFTYNNAPRRTISLLSYNKFINNIPVANSTNNTNFFTGLLWDMSDGGNEYNGSQDIIFITLKNLTLEGKYGTYDYELRVPASLKNYKLGSGTVSFYIEIV